jgi:hypothetical protein
MLSESALQGIPHDITEAKRFATNVMNCLKQIKLI